MLGEAEPSSPAASSIEQSIPSISPEVEGSLLPAGSSVEQSEATAVLTSESQGIFSDQSSSDDGSDFDDTTYFSDVSSISCDDDSTDDVLESQDPLYPDSLIDTSDFQVLLMSAFQQHNLTYSCQDDLLKILSVVLPSPAKVPSSSYVLRNKFVKFNDQCSVHYFCSGCLCSLPSSTAQCVTAGCIDSPHQPVSQYIHLSLSTQLQEHFQGEFIEYYINYVYLTHAYHRLRHQGFIQWRNRGKQGLI